MARQVPGRPGPQPSDGVHKLVDKALGDVGLPDDALLVILADGAAQLVVVHGRAVLSDAPKPGHLSRVLNLEDAWGSRRAQRQAAVQVGNSQRERAQDNRSVSQKATPARVGGGGARAPAEYLLPRLWRGLKKCVRGACHRAQEVVSNTMES